MSRRLPPLRPLVRVDDPASGGTVQIDTREGYARTLLLTVALDGRSTSTLLGVEAVAELHAALGDRLEAARAAEREGPHPFRPMAGQYVKGGGPLPCAVCWQPETDERHR